MTYDSCQSVGCVCVREKHNIANTFSVSHKPNYHLLRTQGGASHIYPDISCRFSSYSSALSQEKHQGKRYVNEQQLAMKKRDLDCSHPGIVLTQAS